MTITKTEKGFEREGVEYVFESFLDKEENTVFYEIVGDSQVHVGTNNGTILLDLSVEINNQIFTDINVFINYLYN